MNRPALPDSLEPVHLGTPAVRVERWTWRLLLAAASIGAISAFMAALVRLGFRGLQWLLTGSAAAAPVAGAHLGLGRRWLTPLIGAAMASLVLWLHRLRDRQEGRPPIDFVEYVVAVRHGHGVIPLLPNCWRTLSAAWSVSSGAAVGREGSMIQFAAAVASACGRWRLWRDPASGAELSFLVACGVAGGVTTAYNAPLAAVFFAAEIVLGGLAWRELPLLGVASGTGWLVSGALLGRARLYPCHVALAQNRAWLLLPVLAIGFGLLGPAYQWWLGALRRRARALPLALLWSGAVVGLCSLADPRVWGNGDIGLSAALGRQELPGTSLAPHGLLQVLGLRLAATTACVWTGTVGGVFTPTLFTGGALGSLVGHVLPGGDPVLPAIAGMSFLMAAVTHAPIMAALMAAELTGDWALLPVLLPLNFLAWRVAARLSPRAMYAIASQSPDGHLAAGGRGSPGR